MRSGAAPGRWCAARPPVGGNATIRTVRELLEAAKRCHDNSTSKGYNPNPQDDDDMFHD